MEYSTPSKPGFYWAKCNGEQQWEPVQVFDDDGFLSAIYPPFGTLDLESFTWGPEIVKPPELEAK